MRMEGKNLDTNLRGQVIELLRQAAFAGNAVVAEIVVDFVAVWTLETAELFAFRQRVGAFAFDEFALCGRERLQTGFTFDEPDESHGLIISDLRFQIEDLNATAAELLSY
jgi:hypothetical protein